MSRAARLEDVVYPERDGKPMGETPVHQRQIVNAILTLSDRFEDDPRARVEGDQLLYYEEGNPAACVCPDVYVSFGVGKDPGRVYKTWEAGKAPDFVLEVSSRSTRVEDEGTKKAIYAMIGVREYVLFDPEADYLERRIRGYRLEGSDYVRLMPRADGRIECRVIGLELESVEQDLRFVDPATGERLPTPAEVRQAARDEAQRAEHEARRAEQESRRAERESRRAEQEAAARRLAEERAARAEAELARLRGGKPQ